MWWQALIPIILELIKKFLENRNPQIASPAFCTDAECDDFAARLESCAAQAPQVFGGVAGHPGGVLAHIAALVAALRAKDWPKIQTLLIDLLSHL